ncbi:MAG: divalent cation tolerance protein CutA [Micavibrio sp.]|nr:divalent cation tolerance protein CutA [Micavibrio sp.]
MRPIAGWARSTRLTRSCWTAKTLMEKLPMLEKLVKQHHSYEVPEILATPVVWAGADYEKWLRESLEV